MYRLYSYFLVLEFVHGGMIIPLESAVLLFPMEKLRHPSRYITRTSKSSLIHDSVYSFLLTGALETISIVIKLCLNSSLVQSYESC